MRVPSPCGPAAASPSARGWHRPCPWLTYFLPSLAIAEVQVLRPDTGVLLDDLADHPHVIVGRLDTTNTGLRLGATRCGVKADPGFPRQLVGAD